MFSFWNDNCHDSQPSHQKKKEKEKKIGYIVDHALNPETGSKNDNASKDISEMRLGRPTCGKLYP